MTAALTGSVLTAVLMRVAEGVGGEAGQAAWAGLSSLVRRALGREPARPPADDEATAGELAAQLLELMRSDPEFAAALREWFAGAAHLGGGDVENVIQGGAQVQGPVVQARDIQGPITF
ncbi:MAG: hypothetical protein ACJ73S_06350 [Mycobacteriales bacterium]